MTYIKLYLLSSTEGSEANLATGRIFKEGYIRDLR